ncbi:MAG TPA: hypothetical protein VKR58_07270 [Aquella sp.]|nr:hypothetical protein [Aquella sp.]
MKLVFILLNFFYTLSVWADCTFNVTNYSDTPVNITAGFFNGESSTATVGVASSGIIVIKNTLKCNAESNIGSGVTYINLVGGKSKGGWVYVPSPKAMIQGIGPSKGSRDMVSGLAPNGRELVLFSNTSPNIDSFDVRIQKAGRNISRQLGSMD